MSEGDQQASGVLAGLAAGGLRELLHLARRAGIQELELEYRTARVRLVREAAPPAGPPGQPGETTVERAADAETITVSAECVGFFHAPGDSPAAMPIAGQEIAFGQTLGLIDSLSVPIAAVAPRAGRVEEVLVEDGQAVEYGQPLFTIRPLGD